VYPVHKAATIGGHHSAFPLIYDNYVVHILVLAQEALLHQFSPNPFLFLLFRWRGWRGQWFEVSRSARRLSVSHHLPRRLCLEVPENNPRELFALQYAQEYRPESLCQLQRLVNNSFFVFVVTDFSVAGEREVFPHWMSLET
jgi:hypothetical protein